MRIIAVLNQKGGVGKTTTVANLGSALARRGQKVCLVDLDPQSNLTMHFGVDPAEVKTSTYDLLTGGATFAQAAVAVEDNLTLLPAVIDLAAAEVELAAEVGREQILRGHLEKENPPYDLMLLDCPPSLGLLTLNALAAAGEVLIPLQPHFLALQGLGRLLETVELVNKRINPTLKVNGVVFCMFESGTKLAGEVVEDVRSFFAQAHGGPTPWSAARVFQTRIRRNIKLAECPSYGSSILKYEPSSNGAKDYLDLAEEFLNPPAVVPAGQVKTAPSASQHGHANSVTMPPVQESAKVGLAEQRSTQPAVSAAEHVHAESVAASSDAPPAEPGQADDDVATLPDAPASEPGPADDSAAAPPDAPATE